MKKSTLLLFIACLCLASACTNFLITKGASEDGSNMITYAADSHTLYGALYHYPRGRHAPGSMRQIHDWDTGKYLGEIPEAEETYNVIGNMNEFQVAIGETTYGGRHELEHQPGAIMDYGSLIWVSLQRSKTAREAIHWIDTLSQRYGYYSEGESFSIMDKNEVWIMEIIGKGAFEKGAVWVARRVPDGYVCAHANQARIQTFPLNDPENCMYSPDVISFARKRGYFSGPDAEFSFSDTYYPVGFEGARGCEVRAWSFFNRVSRGMDRYLNYVQGYNLTNRMPLWVRPTHKISVNQTMNLMRDHLEGTWFDFRKDVGAQAYEMPYRWRPLTWTHQGRKYVNERSTATQQTGWSFVAQARSWLPDQIGALLWFGVDDTASTVYAPMYAAMNEVPQSWSTSSGKIMEFSFHSAFWVFNMVTNFAYQRYSLIHPEIEVKIAEYENKFFELVRQEDQHAAELHRWNPAQAIRDVTEFSVTQGERLTKGWLEFWKYLFMKYMDGNVKTPNPGHQNPHVQWPGYPKATYDRIVAETGDHYLVH